MSQGTMDHPRTGLNSERQDVARDPAIVGPEVEFPTSVAEVRLLTGRVFERLSFGHGFIFLCAETGSTPCGAAFGMC